MVGKSFDVVYDDFSGGHFVGPVGTHQPRNTYIGYNIQPDPLDGSLVPLETFWTISSSVSGTDAAANCSKILAFGGGYFWSGNTNTYKMTSAGVVTNTAIANAVRIQSHPISFAGNIIYITAAGTEVLTVTTGLGVTVTTLPTTVSGNQRVVAWGQYVMAFGLAGKVYFSNPGTSTVWTSTDWFQVGDSSTSGDLLVHQGSLYISTNIGWWVATGIPGQTLSLRQITTAATGVLPMSIDTSIVSAAPLASSLNTGYVIISSQPFYELTGNRDRPLNFSGSPDGRHPYPMFDAIRVGHYYIASTDINFGSLTDDGGGSVAIGCLIWVLNFNTGVWTRRQLTTHNSINLMSGPSAAGDLIAYRTDTGGAQIYFSHLSLPGLFLNQDNTLPSASADLAEYFHNMPFIVKEVLCEVDYGQITYGTIAASEQRQVSISLKTPGTPIESTTDLRFSRAQTSTLTQTLPASTVGGMNQTTRRAWVRFAPTDGQDTYQAIPVVTLKGLKLRRLILKCVEV